MRKMSSPFDLETQILTAFANPTFCALRITSILGKFLWGFVFSIQSVNTGIVLSVELLSKKNISEIFSDAAINDSKKVFRNGSLL